MGDRALELGGGKQRALLGALLLRAGSTVPDGRLVDDVWGVRPPPSASHGLEAYVSRLRQELAPHGVSIARAGGGYRLDPGGATLDVRDFEERAEEAFSALAADNVREAATRAGEALALWRGPVLAGIPIHLDGSSELHQLDELRIRVLESYVDASLALGHHGELVGELRRAVEEHPYREGLVARLMVALYRSGRQAEALEVYERTRRVLGEDLGIQPGLELQQLSGRIVRHDPGLSVDSRSPDAPPAKPRRSHRERVVPVAVAVVITVLVAAVVGLTWDGAAAGDLSNQPTRVALVLPRAPTAGREDTFVTPFVNGLMHADREYGLDATTIVVDEFEPTPARLEEVRRELRAGDFDLVLWAGSGLAAWKVLPLVTQVPRTRFVYVDASLEGHRLRDQPNVTALQFADDDAGFLAGYLAGRVTARRNPLDRHEPIVSVIGGFPIPQVRGLVDGFTRGAKQALPGIGVRVAYSGSFTDQSICERMANHQIDRGSTVVFAASGTCGLGALAAAGLRGVWGVGADADRSYLGTHVLVSTVKRYDRAVELAVRWFLQGSLPQGDVSLGLDDDAVGIAGISPEVAPAARRGVARLAALLRKSEAAPSS